MSTDTPLPDSDNTSRCGGAVCLELGSDDSGSRCWSLSRHVLQRQLHTTCHAMYDAVHVVMLQDTLMLQYTAHHVCPVLCSVVCHMHRRAAVYRIQSCCTFTRLHYTAKTWSYALLSESWSLLAITCTCNDHTQSAASQGISLQSGQVLGISMLHCRDLPPLPVSKKPATVHSSTVYTSFPSSMSCTS